jgi:hypothetical protein
MPSLDDALQFLIAYLRQPRSPSEGGSYGYDFYIPSVCRAFAINVDRVPAQDQDELERQLVGLSAVFYEAAWELCRRGIILPGVRRHGEQATDDGSGGNGYSLTSLGRPWLADAEHTTFIPVEPSRVAALIGRFRCVWRRLLSESPGGREIPLRDGLSCMLRHVWRGC